MSGRSLIIPLASQGAFWQALVNAGIEFEQDCRCPGCGNGLSTGRGWRGAIGNAILRKSGVFCLRCFPCEPLLCTLFLWRTRYLPVPPFETGGWFGALF